MVSLVFAMMLAGAPAEPAPAAPPAGATAATATPTKGEKPKSGDMVCKKEAVVGSRMPSRICMTQQDWDLRRQDSRDELKKIQQGQPFQSH